MVTSLSCFSASQTRHRWPCAQSLAQFSLGFRWLTLTLFFSSYCLLYSDFYSGFSASANPLHAGVLIISFSLILPQGHFIQCYRINYYQYANDSVTNNFIGDISEPQPTFICLINLIFYFEWLIDISNLTYTMRKLVIFTQNPAFPMFMNCTVLISAAQAQTHKLPWALDDPTSTLSMSCQFSQTISQICPLTSNSNTNIFIQITITSSLD